jgi:hypothetical protein
MEAGPERIRLLEPNREVIEADESDVNVMWPLKICADSAGHVRYKIIILICYEYVPRRVSIGNEGTSEKGMQAYELWDVALKVFAVTWAALFFVYKILVGALQSRQASRGK